MTMIHQYWPTSLCYFIIHRNKHAKPTKKLCNTNEFAWLSSHAVFNLLDNDKFCILNKICLFKIDFSTMKMQNSSLFRRWNTSREENPVKPKLSLLLHHVIKRIVRFILMFSKKGLVLVFSMWSVLFVTTLHFLYLEY